MENYIKAIEELWQIRESLSDRNDKYIKKKKFIDEIIGGMQFSTSHSCLLAQSVTRQLEHHA